jgi:hypothetical protein
VGGDHIISQFIHRTSYRRVIGLEAATRARPAHTRGVAS